MGKQHGAILLLALVVLLILAGLSTVGLRAQQQFARAEKIAAKVADQESRALSLLKQHQMNWQQWLLLWPPSQEELESTCSHYWLLSAGAVCEQSLIGGGRLWWLWQHQNLNSSVLTLIVQTERLQANSHQLWAWDVLLDRHEEQGWQAHTERWYQARHPVTGTWRLAEGERWWSEVSH